MVYLSIERMTSVFFPCTNTLAKKNKKTNKQELLVTEKEVKNNSGYT